MKHVVKRHGRPEAYDARKIYASSYAAVLAARQTTDSAELIAERVTADVNAWMSDKHEVTARDLRAQVAACLTVLQPQAGLIYKHHRIL